MSLLLIVCNVLLTSSLIQLHERGRNETKSLEELIAAVVSAEPYEQREAYLDLFAAVGNDDLPTLQRHSDMSISIQAAWEAALRTLTDEERNKGRRPHDEQALSRFLGFVEGRTRTAVPKWWAEFVLKRTKQNWYHNAGQRFVSAPNDTTISIEDGSYTLHVSDDSVTLPDSILEKSDSGELASNFSAVFTEKHCFVAIHDDVGYPHNVLCIDRTGGKLLWVEEACGCWSGGASGGHESWVSVTVQGAHVVIFGASWTGLYVHSFDSGSGKTRFKFSTLFS